MITSLTKHRADDAQHKVLTCEAEGVPEPSFQWSVNSTNVSVGARVSEVVIRLKNKKRRCSQSTKQSGVVGLKCQISLCN